MNTKLNNILTSLIIACVCTVAGAVLDVQVLKAKVESTKETLGSRLDGIIDQLELIREDIKYLREKTDKGNK